MKRKPYPKYKDSGVEWLGQVPEHWEVRRLKFLVTTLGGGTPNTNKPEYWDGEIPWVSPKDMKSIEIADAEDHITELGLRDSASNLIPANTVLVVMRSGILKHTIPVAISQVPVAINQDMKALFSENTLSAKYLYYFIEGLQKFLLPIWTKQGCTVESIETDYMVNTLFPVISIPEQSAIAAFLDQKTAQIDALIQKKKELIAKLGEQRIALITQAVTKGLNPKAKFKDSGVEWLGQVPEHWEVSRFSYNIAFQEGPGIMANDFASDGIPLLRIRNVQSRFVELEGCNFLDPQKVETTWSHFRCKLGDLLISGSASTGLVCEVGDDGVGSIPYTGLIRLWPLTRKVNQNFIRWIVSSVIFHQQIKMYQAGSTIQHFGPEHLNKMIITTPPIIEQLEIVSFLDRRTLQIDALVRKAEEAVVKLEEYRMAVITAAVTGKVDVGG